MRDTEALSHASGVERLEVSYALSNLELDLLGDLLPLAERTHLLEESLGGKGGVRGWGTGLG